MSLADNETDADLRDELFVGRSREFGLLRACATKARGGEASLAVVEGEAGIGKSALARRLAASLDGFTILWATGDPSEADLPFGVISQLMLRLDPALIAPFPLLAQQSAAGASPYAIGGQLLLLLGALQESRGPVAIVVDDVQWADPLSSQVLGFVLRRLWADRVLTVLLTRSDAEGTVAAPEPAATVRCTGCGRPLRDPASRARGHGPICTVVRLPEPPRGEQEETLPGL